MILFFFIIKMVKYMKIRCGYACITKTIDKKFKTVNYSNFNDNYDKLNDVIKHNLDTLYEILLYNVKNNIHFYRITSNLIPLIDHPNIDKNKIYKFNSEFKRIKKLVRENGMRVDMHSSEYVVINSVRKEVVSSSFSNIKELYRILSKITDTPYIVMHVGSNVFGKKLSMSRFKNNFKKLPKKIRDCIIIENDDKIFNIEDVIELSKLINVPIVFDYHHHICNHNNLKIDFDSIFSSWNDIPKMHISSSRSNKKSEFRSHHDFIDVGDFIELCNKLKNINEDVDIMIEAKEKDNALFKLVRELKYLNYNFIDETTLEL